MRQIQELRTENSALPFSFTTWHFALILFVLRLNGAFMSTCLKVITRLGTDVYFPIRSMGAGRHPCGALVYLYISLSLLLLTFVVAVVVAAVCLFVIMFSCFFFLSSDALAPVQAGRLAAIPGAVRFGRDFRLRHLRRLLRLPVSQSH